MNAVVGWIAEYEYLRMGSRGLDINRGCGWRGELVRCRRAENQLARTDSREPGLGCRAIGFWE